MSSVVYTLALQGGYYYVGKTNNLKRRIEEHRSHASNTPEWTRLHPMVGVLEQQADVPGQFTEHIQTLRMMKKFSIDQVRGDVYCAVNLSQETIESLNSILASSDSVCYICYSKGHFANNCPDAIESGCSRCGRENHNAEQCFATRDIDGRRLY